MSSTYSEIYTTNLRNQSMILKGEKTNKPSSKYVTLIKNFTKRDRMSSVPKSKFKPRRINSKSVQNQILKKKNNTKKKTKSKQKLEKSQKEKDRKEKDKQKQKERNEINNNNKTSYRINNYISKSTDFKKEGSNNIKLQKINEKEIINNFLSDINNNTYNNSNNNNNNDYCMYNTLQNKNNNNIYNNFNNYVKLSKTSYDNSFNNYFDIFRLRRRAANFRDIMTNSLSERKSKNCLSPIYNINKTNKYLNTITDFNPKKSKTLFEVKRLKEKINKLNNNNNNFNQYLVPHPGYNLKNNENNIFEELLETNNNSNQNEIDKQNTNNVDSNKNNDNNNNNDIKNITYHFFDRNIKMPKRIKKYLNGSSGKLNHNTKNMNRDNNDNNSNQQDIKLISQNIKNSFRNSSKYLLNHSNNFKSFKDDLKFNNLNCCFSPDLYRNKFKNDMKINLNLITQENVKLNSLLKKIPSSREFKNKSYDLMNYILKFRKNKSKNNILNMTNDSNFQCIYPVNECDLFSQTKNDFLC